MINGEKEVFPFEEKYTVENVAEKLGTSIERVRKRLSWFSNSSEKHRHTRQYILKQIYENGITWSKRENKGIFLKEDFIEGYYISREENNKKIFNYDFSNLPDIIKSKKTDVKIFVNEISTKKKELIGEWETNYHDLVVTGDDNRQCAGMISKEKTAQFISTEEFIRRSKKKFPGKFGYSRTKYINLTTKVTLQCLTCGEFFDQMPAEHLNGTGKCPKCVRTDVGRKNAISQEDFVKRVKEIYGDTIDLSKAVYLRSRSKINGNKDNHVIVIDPKTGKEYSVGANSLLRGSFSFERIKSKGEKYISISLEKLNIPYIPQAIITKDDMTELNDIQNKVLVDFMLENYNGDTYIIEYNGSQHYYPDYSFHKDIENYSKQIQRDEALERYCIRKNIKLIVIPYIINTQEEIFNIIQKIFINGENIESVVPHIDPQKLENYE